MKRILFVLLLGSSLPFLSYSQGLYTPRDFQKAYKKETRSSDGQPGKKYWQNFGRYQISLTALPPDRNIKGTEQIAYINNSPDTLRTLIIRLVLNIHRPGALRYQNARRDYLTPGIQIDKLTVNGNSQPWNENENTNTWQPVRLTNPLLPHDSIHLAFDWHYQISLESGREGMIDSTTYFLAYCYPRVSVYDDYNGWDDNEFTDQQEFYNDFNDYSFSVTVPRNYIVWATGDLLNPDEVLQPKFAQRLKESMVTDSVIRVATKEDLAAKNITAQNDLITWRWKADYVSDVTIGLSDHYNWDASSVIVDDATRRRASVQSAYNDKAADFHHMVEFGRHSLDWLSHNWPGIPYPYQKTTIFQGFADMEYPMMVNDGSQQDLNFSRFVAEHEIAHTWFPFYMGINENRFGFMDEGWATTFELLIGRADLGVERAENLYKLFRVQQWIKDASQEEDLPIITPANVLRGASYGNNAYGKPSLGYLAMKDLLGDRLFRKCLHGYIERWHGKHPIPWDFFYSFNDISGKNLNWFWSNWYFSNYYIDLAIQKVQTLKTGYSVTLQNIGGYVAPVDVVATYTDGTTESLHQTPAIWETNQKTSMVTISTKKKIKSLQLKGGIFMDADESNNSWNAQ